MKYPIDIVFTWVDSNDETWKEKRLSTLKQLNKPLPIDGTDNSRFRNNDELLYSLRSIEKFAPWVRKIFIVTDEQRPVWLNTNNPKVQIIDHKKIFANTSALPTFNSMAIESRLHHIDDISEHFIYFNDDFFLGSECTPDYFFNEYGQPYVFTNWRKVPYIKRIITGLRLKIFERNTHHHAITNSRNLISEKTGKTTWIRVSHGVKPFLKSTCFELEFLFNDEFSRTEQNRFRSNEDILVSALYSFYSIVNKSAAVKILYESPLIAQLLKERIRDCFFVYAPTNGKKFIQQLSLIMKIKPKQFCINDMPGTDEAVLEQVKNFFQTYFKDKSSFEV